MKYSLVPLEHARWSLARLWFIASAIIFLLLVAQSVGGTYEGNLQTAWGWALPNFVPTLALMVSVFAADALRPYSDAPPSQVREPFYKLSLGLSVFYLFALLATILSEPIFLYARQGEKVTAIDLLQVSNLWLGPLQGVVVAALGVLFFLKDEERKTEVGKSQPTESVKTPDAPAGKIVGLDASGSDKRS
jgi:hypothetical protein